MKAFQPIITNFKLYDLGYGFLEIIMVFDMISKIPYKNLDMVSKLQQKPGKSVFLYVWIYSVSGPQCFL